MTQKQIEAAAERAVYNNDDLEIMRSVEWLHDGGFIEYKQYMQILNAITKAWKTTQNPA